MARKNTKGEIVAAALATLKERGYAGTSSRTIAAVGDFNPALIFYYFGSLDGLLVAALEHSSGERLERYRRAVEEAGSLAALLNVLGAIYRDDVASGHIRVVSELVAASVSQPELAPRVIALMEPWLELAERAAARVAPPDLPVPPRQLALAAVTFYLGANLLTHLVPEAADVEALLETAARAAPLLDALAAG
jgi:AcrR family transcriptional regulator